MSIDGGSVTGRMSYEILPIEVTSEPQRSAAESSVSLAHTSFLCVNAMFQMQMLCFVR